MNSLFLIPLTVLLFAPMTSAVHAAGASPNVVLLLVDDVGYSDIAVHGNPISDEDRKVNQ